MNSAVPTTIKIKRCAVYTRKSSEEGLDQEFNSLDAQREAGEAYVKSQRHEGWALLENRYDDGGISGGTMKRPGLTQLLADVEAGLVDIIVVYKVDRLSRSLPDFGQMVELFDKHGVNWRKWEHLVKRMLLIIGANTICKFIPRMIGVAINVIRFDEKHDLHHLSNNRQN